MIRSGTFAVAVCTGLAGPVLAADEEGRYAVEGPGRLTCSDLTALEPADPMRRDLAVWMTGYLTAHHRLLSETFDLTPWQTPGTVLAMVEQYCTANPEAIAERAAQELVSHLGLQRVESETPVLMQRAGDQVTLLYEGVIESATAALAAQGFAAEPGEEGLAGAVRGFQRSEGLAETGALDQATLARLLR